MKILFVVPYPSGKAPSQRFRFEQYLDFLKEKGWRFTIAPFIDDTTWQILYKPGHTVQKTWGITKGLLKRIFLLLSVPAYDYIFIHREATPIGPPWFEWMVAKGLRKKLIYDFDDAIWLPNTSENNKIVAGIKWPQKVAAICRWAYKVSAGNDYLCNYARQFNLNVVLNPTTIDTENLHNPEIYAVLKVKSNKPVIGWTGTHSTLKYLEPLVPVLQKLEKQYNFELCIIANQKPEWNIKSLNFVLWNKQTEIPDLMRFDIGLMPLTDDKWARGKCGFKALQYMALEVPALVSPIGVNTTIVDHGKTGFICYDLEDWVSSISVLLQDADLRQEMGRKARVKIVESYSVKSNINNFIKLFS